MYWQFQTSDVSSEMDSGSLTNEYNAIKLSILKAIGSNSYQKCGKYSNIKSVSVDMPCSQDLFKKTFLSNISDMNYVDERSIKYSVTPSDLNGIFGHNWQTFQYKNSSTQRRIIGLVHIHFREKSIPQKNAQKHNNR